MSTITYFNVQVRPYICINNIYKVKNIVAYLPKVKTEHLVVKDAEGNEIFFDFEKISKLKNFAIAIQNSTRFSIINLLSNNRELTVTELYEKLNIDQPICSRHLKVLRANDVLLARREGKFIHYSINPKIKWITRIDIDALMVV